MKLRQMTLHIRIQKACKQQGALLLEAIVAILIFSIGILSLMGLQATAIKFSDDAKYRTDAAFLANKVISQMWLGDLTQLNTFALNSAVATTCGGGAIPATSSPVYGWATSDLKNALPGAAADHQKIVVNPDNSVTVTICWQTPTDKVWHNFITSARIGKN